MNSIQIALLGVVGTLLALQFKSGKSEYGIYVSLAVSLFLFLCMLSRLEIFVQTVKKIADYIKLDAGQMSILLKMAGVTYVAEFASGICKDAGYQNIAVQIEIFTKLTILAIGMPVLLSLLELILIFHLPFFVLYLLYYKYKILGHLFLILLLLLLL